MVLEKIKAIICSQFDIDEDDITADSTLDELGIDSIDAVDLAMNIEDEFEVEIPDDELENFKCVGDVVKFIEEA